MPYGRDKLVLALALPPSPPGFLPSGKNQEAPKKSLPKEEFEKILFKAAFELGMPDPSQNPEETLDWLLKKQRERRLTIQEQELLEALIKLLGKNNANPLLVSGQLVSGSSVPDFEKMALLSEWEGGYSGIMKSDGTFALHPTITTQGKNTRTRLQQAKETLGEIVYTRQASHQNLARRIFRVPIDYTNVDIENLYGFSINLGANNTIEVGFSSGSINFGPNQKFPRGITKGMSGRDRNILKIHYQDYIMNNLKAYFLDTKYQNYKLVKKPADKYGHYY